MNHFLKILTGVFPLILIQMLFTSCGEHIPKSALALAGTGIVVDKDTIYLERTSERALMKILNMADSLPQADMGSACGFDENGDSFSVDTYSREIFFKGMTFKYHGYRKDTLLLESIEMKEHPDFKVFVGVSLLGKKAYHLEWTYKKRSKYDEVSESKLWNEMGSYGIDYHLDTLGRLTYVRIYEAIPMRNER